jgi:hypothetical protein
MALVSSNSWLASGRNQRTMGATRSLGKYQWQILCQPYPPRLSEVAIVRKSAASN